jgi:hypothetical protein
MRVYYRSADVVVTSELFIRRGETAEKFAIRDLRNVGIAPDGADGSGAVPLLVAAALLVVSAVLFGAIGAVSALIPFAAAGIVAAYGFVRRQHRSRCQVLTADYRGAGVTLWSSADERVFNQVGRALRRAVEDLPPSTWDDHRAA